jgi:adenylate cyclase
MCRSAEQPMLVSAAFAEIGDNKARLVSVGRYALRGVGRAQELFTLEPSEGGSGADSSRGERAARQRLIPS